MYMTLAKLAAICGVSVSTVSKAFSESSEISEKTKKMIFAAAKENGCFDKYHAQKFEKKIIAVLIPEIRSAYYTSFIDSLEEHFLKNDMRIVLSATNFSKEDEIRLIQYYINFAHADAVIVIDGKSRIDSIQKVPVVFLLSSYEPGCADCISLKGTHASDEAFSFLKAAGHREIAFIGERLTEKRQSHFIAAIRKSGLKLQKKYIIISDRRFEDAGYSSMSKILEAEEQPTAIIAAYSYIAYGIIKCITDHGKSVPGDFSVISMDDSFDFTYSGYDLTRISMQIKDICSIAADIVIKKIKNPNFTAMQNISVYNKFVPGNTVKKIN